MLNNIKLQTNIPFQKQIDHQIGYQSKLLLLGSCFVENIGQKLTYFKFQAHCNPFGVLFHPKAIENLVDRAIREKEYVDDDVFFHNEQWHCFEAHSTLSHVNKATLIANLNTQLQLTKRHLTEASHLVITFGTAWVYKQAATNWPVANCHKVPQANFNKALLTVSEITEALSTIHTLIKTVNPSAHLIFTVSPIRHLKDGFVENTQGKAHLITAVHDFILKSSKQDGYYFPSYEIMMDELRDYRFYAEDMIHPNATAIHYIWEKFRLVWLSESTLPIMEDVDHIQKAMAHRPFRPNSDAHATFLKQLQLRKEALNKKLGRILF